MKRALFLGIILSMVVGASIKSASAEVFQLKSGDIVQGTVIFESDRYFRLENQAGIQQVVFKKHVMSNERDAETKFSAKWMGQSSMTRGRIANEWQRSALGRTFRNKYPHTSHQSLFSRSGMTFLFVATGGIMLGISGIWITVIAFFQNPFWGIGCLAMPATTWIFGFLYWDKSQVAMQTSFLGLGLTLAGMGLGFV